MKIIVAAITFEQRLLVGCKLILEEIPISGGDFHYYMRGAVLRHATSQHYVFSYKINEGQGQGQGSRSRSRSRSKVKGQGQRSRSVKINIITKIPYYPFITLRNLRFSQSILVTAVCLLLCEISYFRKVYWSPPFVCVSVCLSVCLSFRDVQTTPLVRLS